jgi:hypothetical protein
VNGKDIVRATGGKGGVVGLVVSPADAMSVLNLIIDSAQEYLQVREVERTKRDKIAANKKVALKTIHDRSELFLTYLDRSFDEREKNFANLFGALDKAMTEGVGNVAEILGAITTLAAASPFKDLHDPVRVREALDDPDHEWDV